MKPRCLAIMPYYNDDDIIKYHIEYYLSQEHDLIIFDHGSTDNTSKELDKYNSHPSVIERHFLPRHESQLNMAPPTKCSRNEQFGEKVWGFSSTRPNWAWGAMLDYTYKTFQGSYDWITFAESDEFLEGPSRSVSYYESIDKIFNQGYDFPVFETINYWFTEKDDESILDPTKRIKHYSWRDRRTDAEDGMYYSYRLKKGELLDPHELFWGHSRPKGTRATESFRSKHYQCRGLSHAVKRNASRKGIGQKGLGENYHFEDMQDIRALLIPSSELHYDDGSEYIMGKETIDWKRQHSGGGERFFSSVNEFLDLRNSYWVDNQPW